MNERTSTLLHLFNRPLFVVFTKNPALLIHFLSKIPLCPPSEAAVTREKNIQLFQMTVCGFYVWLEDGICFAVRSTGITHQRRRGI